MRRCGRAAAAAREAKLAPLGATTHLAWRAALAIGLMVSFYGFALLIIAVLVAIPLGLVRMVPRPMHLGLSIQVGLFTIAAAYGILRSIFPRRDRFEAPGPRITPKDQPRLFQEIRSVAHAVGQPEPAEVYVIPQANAFVGQRGGFMGLRSRRVMGVGLPLLQILTVAELRGVLAHEFGHFHGGDVAISPWVRETSSALGRTLQEMEDHSQVLMMPFVWYANFFFRLSYQVSRHQELLADQLAAGVAGPRTLASALQQSDHAEMAFFYYWQSTVEPVLDAGFRPPLAEGFGAFLQSPTVQRRLAEIRQEMERTGPQSPHDTHPPLEERLAALGIEPSRTERDAGPPALSLLDDLVEVETGLAAMSRTPSPTVKSKRVLSLNIAPEPRALTPIAWDEVGAKVWIPLWQRMARDFGHVLRGVTAASLPELEWKHPGTKILGGQSDGDPLEAADGIVGITLAVAFSQAGFTVESPPGEEPPVMVGRGERVHVFSLRERLSKGIETPETWRALCARSGIADVDLGSIARPATGS